MHAVIETAVFVADCDAAGLSYAERHSIVEAIAANRRTDVLIPGTGGARKLRFAGRGKGKSGGYRVVTFCAAENVPVFLLALVDKGERADLSQAERDALRQTLGGLADE